MKVEDMAKEYADNINGLELTCSLLSAKDKNHAYRLGRYDGFLAGFKACARERLNATTISDYPVKDEYTLPKDILGLWEQTVCEIRGEIKSWDLKGPHVSDYAKELCDKLEHSMCALAGGPYRLNYSIGDY